MVAYLWLVWYEAPSKRLPKHWALAVTYETHERAYATFYEITGDSPVRYQPKVVRRVHIVSDHGTMPFDGKILLGEITDNVLGALEMYSETAAELVNNHNRKSGRADYGCHNWATIIVRSLEDALLLPPGTVARVEKCPKFG